MESMIYEVKMFAGKCDNCGKEVMENTDYSCVGDTSLVHEEMSEQGWVSMRIKIIAQTAMKLMTTMK